MKPRILIGSPTSNHKNYCVGEFVLNLKAQGHDYLVVDNSRTQNHQLGLLLGHPIPWLQAKANADISQLICASQNFIRDEFLKKDYTHLAFLESDLLPPLKVFDRLALHDTDIVGHPYFILKHQMRQAMIHTAEFIKDNLTVSISTLEKGFGIVDGNLKKVFSVGFGCVLIKREIIEDLKFHLNTNENLIDRAGLCSSDSFFYAQCAQKGYEVYADTSKTIKHYNSNWN